MKICIAVFHHDIRYKPTIVLSNKRKVGDCFKFYFDFDLIGHRKDSV